MSKRSQKPVKAAAAVPAGYGPLLAELKSRVRAAQLRAATSVTRELNQLYWEIGSAIARAQESKGYGKQVVERLAADLQTEFPGMAGFSPQNVWFMRSFYLAWSASEADSLTAVRESRPPDSLAVARVSPTGSPPEAVTDLPWGHNRLLLTKLKKPAERLWYAQAALRHGCPARHEETHRRGRVESAAGGIVAQTIAWRAAERGGFGARTGRR